MFPVANVDAGLSVSADVLSLDLLSASVKAGISGLVPSLHVLGLQIIPAPASLGNLWENFKEQMMRQFTGFFGRIPQIILSVDAGKKVSELVSSATHFDLGQFFSTFGSLSKGGKAGNDVIDNLRTFVDVQVKPLIKEYIYAPGIEFLLDKLIGVIQAGLHPKKKGADGKPDPAAAADGAGPGDLVAALQAMDDVADTIKDCPDNKDKARECAALSAEGSVIAEKATMMMLEIHDRLIPQFIWDYGVAGVSAVASGSAYVAGTVVSYIPVEAVSSAVSYTVGVGGSAYNFGAATYSKVVESVDTLKQACSPCAAVLNTAGAVLNDVYKGLTPCMVQNLFVDLQVMIGFVQQVCSVYIFPRLICFENELAGVRTAQSKERKKSDFVTHLHLPLLPRRFHPSCRLSAGSCLSSGMAGPESSSRKPWSCSFCSRAQTRACAIPRCCGAVFFGVVNAACSLSHLLPFIFNP